MNKEQWVYTIINLKKKTITFIRKLKLKSFSYGSNYYKSTLLHNVKSN